MRPRQERDKRHEGDEDIIQALRELNDNPFEATIDIKAKSPDQYAQIASYFENPALSRYVSNVNYAENQFSIERLNSIINSINRGGLLITVILVVIAALVVFNTIRLAIYSNRDEISVMRAVGASNAFVRGPFVVQGIMSGALAAIISVLFIVPGIYSVNPYIKQAVPEIDLAMYVLTNLPLLLLYQIIAGILVSGLSSFVAVRRYLHG